MYKRKRYIPAQGKIHGSLINHKYTKIIPDIYEFKYRLINTAPIYTVDNFKVKKEQIANRGGRDGDIIHNRII